jgi:transketolase
MSQRDTFWWAVAARAARDERIVIVTADMSAPGLDDFRRQFPNRYINVGIAEQAMVSVAAGLALEGMRPFCYAIQPFAGLRALEVWKCAVVLHALPVVLVGVGAGLSYSDSGPTHHALGDLGAMLAIPGTEVLCPSSRALAENAASHCLPGQIGPAYVRLDRQTDLPEYGRELTPGAVKSGVLVHRSHPKRMVVTSGVLVHEALQLPDTGVIEIWRFPFDPGALSENIRGLRVAVWEETTGAVYDQIARSCPTWRQVRPVYAQGYSYQYGGRAAIRKSLGIDIGEVREWLEEEE